MLERSIQSFAEHFDGKYTLLLRFEELLTQENTSCDERGTTKLEIIRKYKCVIAISTFSEDLTGMRRKCNFHVGGAECVVMSRN